MDHILVNISFQTTKYNFLWSPVDCICVIHGAMCNFNTTFYLLFICHYRGVELQKETKRNKGVETLRLKKSKRGNEITRYSTNTSYIVLYDHNNLKHFRTIYDPLHQNNVNMT